MHTPVDHQKHIGCARRMAYKRQIHEELTLNAVVFCFNCVYLACCYCEYKTVPTPPSDHFSSDYHGDETGSTTLIVSRPGMVKDGCTS